MPATLPPQDAASRALMPNLFVIGASKSGSSALHAYLRAHPEICMSREKEPCFFVDQAELEAAWPIMARRPCSHDWDAYLALWQGGESLRYRGEGSVFYSQVPHRSGVAARIAEACPDARIIYTVREPVTRAIGHYWQRYKEFAEPRGLETALRENALYRDTSDYALQLETYLAHFDRDQIYILVAEDLRSHREETLAGVIDWLGLPPYAYRPEELTERHKSPPTSRRQRFPLVAKIRDSGVWATARRVLPKAAVDRLRSTATVQFDKKEVDETAARAYLAAHLAERTRAFETMIGRHINAWH
jgi:hypothetical protein